MLIVHVDIAVKPECINDFISESLANARESLKEPGVARFDLIQSLDDPSQFMLLEVYRDEQAPAQHKASAHYARWAQEVAPMMARPRQSRKYRNLHPDEAGWPGARP